MSAGQLAVQRELSEVFRDALDKASGAGALALQPDGLLEPTLERLRLAEYGD